MDQNTFWKLIDKVNAAVPHSDHDAILRETKKALCDCTVEDILDWDLIMDQYKQAAYRNDLWAASAAMGAHYSDDGFIDFRCWLISCGRKTYMDALQDPDSLAGVDVTGEELNFELYGYAANDAYRQKTAPAQSREDYDVCAMYKRLNTYKLAPQTIAEIQAELPQRPDIRDWSEYELPLLFPRIHAQKMKPGDTVAGSRGAMEKLLESRDLVHAYVYQGGERREYIFSKSPENIASFIGGHPGVDKIVLTDPLDRLILDTMGCFIDHCPDQELLGQVKKTLIPYQMGSESVPSFYCPALEEVEDYYLQTESLGMELS